MKSKSMCVLFFGLFIAACSSLPMGLIAPAGTEGIIEPTQVLPTKTPNPTATIGYQATAYTALTMERAAQLTAESANLTVAKYTANAMEMELERARITEAAGILSARGTAQSINATGTAAPMVATQAYNSMMINLAEKTSIAYEPTLLFANEQTRLFIKNGERDENIFYGMKIAATFMTIALALYLLAVAFATAAKASQPAQASLQKPIPDLNAIPMVADVHNPNVTHRAEINCSPDQLKQLAEGIINGRKTLAFNQWTGTPVYSNLKNIRDFMQGHSPPMARLLLGKGGELSIEAIGEDFLLQCLSGSPPEPYVCLIPSPVE